MQWEWHITYTIQLSTCILFLNDVTCIPSSWSFWYDGNCFEPIPHYGITNIFGYNSCSIEPSKLIRPDQFAQTPTAFVQPNGCVEFVSLVATSTEYIYIKLYIIHVSQSPLKLSFGIIQTTFWPQQCHVNWLRNYSRWIAIELCEITIIVMSSYAIYKSFVQNNLLLMQLENFQSGHHEMVSLTSDILISELIRNPMVPTPSQM